jgi:hypothetical protein
MDDREFSREAARMLVDRGLLIEAGFVGLIVAAYPEKPTPLQAEQLRNAFFAGAQHLFASIMGVLDDEQEPSATDMARMDQINRELEAFITDFQKRYGLESR